MSMAKIDYSFLQKLIEAKGIPRRQLALRIGIDEGQFASSFRRESKMKFRLVIKIANYLRIPADYLLLKNENGNPITPIPADYIDISKFERKLGMNDLDKMLSKLNNDGIEKAKEMIGILLKAPCFIESEEAKEDG